MDGVASRRGLSLSAAGSILAVLALCVTLLPAGSATAQESPSGDSTADDQQSSDSSGSGGLLPLVNFPGPVGNIVQQLDDQLVPTRRYRGLQRFDTARLIAMDGFDNPADAIIARGDLFPDALSGSFLAGQLDAPLLLTSSHRLEPDTQQALQDLDPENVTLIGGTSAISSSVEQALGQAGYATNRVGGEDRFETASMVAGVPDAVIGEREGHGRTAIVARADEFADALVAGTLSYTADFPLLLTTGNRLHPDTASTLSQQSIDHVIVPGGQAAVSDGVVDEIESQGIGVERVSGIDRVATSVNFAEFMRDEFGFGLDRINTAIGTRFADALALGPLSGSAGQPVILTANETTLGGDGAVQQFLSQTCSIDLAGIGGGHAAISQGLADQIRQIATSTGAPCILDLVPQLANRSLGDQHTVTSTLTDNAGTPLGGQEVRTEIYRATDLGLPTDLGVLDNLNLGALQDAVAGLPADEILATLQQQLAGLGLGDVTFASEPVETFTATTNADGEVEASYTGPDSPAMDVAVSCLDAESESCVLMDNGQLPDASTVEPATNLLTGSGTVLWGLDVLDLLPNLLLVEPPVDVNSSGQDDAGQPVTHEVTVSSLLANLGGGGPDGLLSGLPDLGGLGDTGGLLNPVGVGELGGLLDGLSLLDGVSGVGLDGVTGGLTGLGELGRPLDADVRLEVYRLTENLPTGVLDGLVGVVGGASSPDDALDQGALLDVLGGQGITGVLDLLSLEPYHTETKATGQNGDPTGQATFDYDGPTDGLGVDLIVACLDSSTDDEGRCLPVVGGGLQLPDDPGVGVAAGLWTPGDVTGLLGGLEGLLSTDQLTQLTELLNLDSVDQLQSLLGDQALLEEAIGGGLLDGTLSEGALDGLLDGASILSEQGGAQAGASAEAGSGDAEASADADVSSGS